MADLTVLFVILITLFPWSAFAYTDGQVRLSGGSSSSEGFVEIYHNYEWGTVCDDYWDDVDATVVCKQLGYDHALRATDRATFGQGTGRIWLDDVDCDGWEESLTQCYLPRGWGNNDCGHSEDAGVVCTNNPPNEGDLRLSDGLRLEEGRVEIYYNGVWGTVCNDYWGHNEAQVTCYQLGYSDVTYTSNYYGAGTGPIHMDNVVCSGSETKLMYCEHDGWGDTYDCSHMEDIGVRCYREGSGMPGWEIALIVICSLLGFCILVAIIASLCNKKKKRRNNQQDQPHPQNDVVYSVTTNNVVQSTTIQQPSYPVQNVVQPYGGQVYDAAPPSYAEVAEPQYPNPAAAPYPNPAAAPYPNPAAAPYPNPTAAPYPNPTAAPYPNPTAAPYPNPSPPYPQGNGGNMVAPTS